MNDERKDDNEDVRTEERTTSTASPKISGILSESSKEKLVSETETSVDRPSSMGVKRRQKADKLSRTANSTNKNKRASGQHTRSKNAQAEEQASIQGRDITTLATRPESQSGIALAIPTTNIFEENVFENALPTELIDSLPIVAKIFKSPLCTPQLKTDVLSRLQWFQDDVLNNLRASGNKQSAYEQMDAYFQCIYRGIRGRESIINYIRTHFRKNIETANEWYDSMRSFQTEYTRWISEKKAEKDLA